MSVSEIVAQRYASAYFDVARTDGAVAPRRAALATAAENAGRDDVLAAVADPRIETGGKVRLVDSLLEGVDATARNLVRLLVERGRLELLGAILEAYDRLADRETGRIRAEVVSAVPVSAQQERRIAEELARRLGGEVQTTVRQDPAVIGGLVIRIGDRVIDGSVRTRLRELQAALA